MRETVHTNFAWFQKHYTLPSYIYVSSKATQEWLDIILNLLVKNI